MDNDLMARRLRPPSEPPRPHNGHSLIANGAQLAAKPRARADVPWDKPADEPWPPIESTDSYSAGALDAVGVPAVSENSDSADNELPSPPQASVLTTFDTFSIAPLRALDWEVPAPQSPAELELGSVEVAAPAMETDAEPLEAVTSQASETPVEPSFEMVEDASVSGEEAVQAQAVEPVTFDFGFFDVHTLEVVDVELELQLGPDTELEPEPDGDQVLPAHMPAHMAAPWDEPAPVTPSEIEQESRSKPDDGASHPVHMAAPWDEPEVEPETGSATQPELEAQPASVQPAVATMTEHMAAPWDVAEVGESEDWDLTDVSVAGRPAWDRPDPFDWDVREVVDDRPMEMLASYDSEEQNDGEEEMVPFVTRAVAAAHATAADATNDPYDALAPVLNDVAQSAKPMWSMWSTNDLNPDPPQAIGPALLGKLFSSTPVTGKLDEPAVEDASDEAGREPSAKTSTPADAPEAAAGADESATGEAVESVQEADEVDPTLDSVAIESTPGMPPQAVLSAAAFSSAASSYQPLVLRLQTEVGELTSQPSWFSGQAVTTDAHPRYELDAAVPPDSAPSPVPWIVAATAPAVAVPDTKAAPATDETVLHATHSAAVLPDAAASAEPTTAAVPAMEPAPELTAEPEDPWAHVAFEPFAPPRLWDDPLPMPDAPGPEAAIAAAAWVEPSSQAAWVTETAPVNNRVAWPVAVMSVAPSSPPLAVPLTSTAGASAAATTNSADLWFLGAEHAATSPDQGEALKAGQPSSLLTTGLTVAMALLVILLVLVFVLLMTSVFR